jgi:hypothetical protein
MISIRNEFGYLLNNLKLLGSGVEVGVSTGGFSGQILKRWQGQKLYLVDSWRHLDDYLDSFNASDEIMQCRYQLAHKRLINYSSRINWLRERSESASKQFLDNSCDFVYIDANHSYQHVTQDIHLWYPKIRPGGLVAGHDYYNALANEALEPTIFGDFDPKELTSYGVKAAVDEFVKKLGVSLFTSNERYPTWFFVKPK